MAKKKFNQIGFLPNRPSHYALPSGGHTESKRRMLMAAKKKSESKSKDTVGHNDYDIQPDFPDKLSPDAAKVVTDLLRGGEGSPDLHCCYLSAWHTLGFVTGQLSQHHTHDEDTTESKPKSSSKPMTKAEAAKCIDDCIIDDDKRPDGYKSADASKAFDWASLIPILMQIIQQLMKPKAATE